MADSSDELREFAARLRLKPEWMQKPGSVLEHYDITASVRELALRLGAVLIAYGEGGCLTLCKRAGIPFDVGLLRRDRQCFQAQLRRHPDRERGVECDPTASGDLALSGDWGLSLSAHQADRSEQR